MEWRLAKHRRRATWSKMTAAEKALLEPFEGLFEEAEEFSGAELMDVVDAKTKKTVALYALWPFGSGVVVDLASKKPIADIVQHYFDAHGDDRLRDRMRAAHEEGKARLGIQEGVDFRKGNDALPKAARAPVDAGTLAEIRAVRSSLAGKKPDPNGVETIRRIEDLIARVFDNSFRPLPLRRPCDLSETEREMLELVYDGYALGWDAWWIGLPHKWDCVSEAESEEPSMLARVLGRASPRPLDATFEVDGKAHPLWALASDVVNELRPDTVLFAAFDALAPKAREAAWRELASRPSAWAVMRPRDEKEHSGGVIEQKALDAWDTRYQSLVLALLLRLGARAEPFGRAIATAGWAKDRLEPDREDGPSSFVRFSAIEGLARLAKDAGGVLDPKHDAALGELATMAQIPWKVFAALLDELPKARAGGATGVDPDLLVRYPSESGLVRVLDLMKERPDMAGPYYEKLVATLAKKVGEPARPHLESAKKTMKNRAALFEKALAAIGGKKKK